MSLTDLLVELEVAKDSKKAGPMEAYMRHQFSFLGVAAPERNKLYKKYFPKAKKTKIIDWDFVDTCWEKESREYQYVAANYLKAMQSYLTESDLPKLEHLVVTKSWWDTVDLLAKVVGSLVIRIEGYDQIMLEWSKDSNIWLRRVAILYQLSLKDKVDKQVLDEILVNNLGDSEFFINKAIGWALRDYSKYNPEWVREFIKKNKENMANLSIREASKYI